MFFDVIVIGAGAMGSSSAFWLSMKDKQVLLLEQFKLLHKNGSSHGDSRIIRKTYKEDYFAELMTYAYESWSKLEVLSGKTLINVTGGLDIGKRTNKFIQEIINNCKNKEYPYKILEAEEIKDIYPQLLIDDDIIAIYQEDGGIVNASEALKILQKLSQLNGVSIRDEEAVVNIKETDSIVEVTTTKATYHCNKLVITAGSWINQIIQPLGYNFNVKLMEVTLAYWKIKSNQYDYSNFPIFIYWDNEVNYGFPVHEKEDYLKIGLHESSIMKPKSDRGEKIEVNDEMLDQIKKFISKTFNDINTSPEFIDTCIYTMTENENFIIDYIPNSNKILIVGGFSGHGFKFTPLIGEIVCDLICETPIVHDLSHFKFSNFID
ncbi:MAG: N-methyl-L-tryptophan oxidase [Candidatus Heimdallarchaeota archaeon]|nr:N-methyl-L-tryptophan oxidase [Candidatus Heimdallarchaeota archaeon]MDH5646929.1 N-methyl-L-tryptophan oxidase [Candidatus Heimdallarchaeota archaeon]